MEGWRLSSHLGTNRTPEGGLFPAEEPVPGGGWAGLEAGVLGADSSALDAGVTSLGVRGRQDVLGSGSSGQEAAGSTAPVWQESGEEMPPQGPCGGTPGCGEARVRQGVHNASQLWRRTARLELRVLARSLVCGDQRVQHHTPLRGRDSLPPPQGLPQTQAHCHRDSCSKTTQCVLMNPAFVIVQSVCTQFGGHTTKSTRPSSSLHPPLWPLLGRHRE